MKNFILIFVLLLSAIYEVRAEERLTCDKKINFDFEIVDIHAHAFNFRYLPVEGILYSRRIPKPFPLLIDKILVSQTGNYNDSSDLIDATQLKSLDSIDGMDEAGFYSLLSAKIESSPDYNELKKNEPKLNKYLASEMKKELESIKEKGISINSLISKEPGHDDQATYIAFFGRQTNELKSLASMEINTDITETNLVKYLESQPLAYKALAILNVGLNVPSTLKGYFKFIAILMLREDLLVTYLQKYEFCEVDIFVHHMMDLERTYKDEPDLEFSEQIKRAESLSKKFEGSLYYFGAFDPFRRDASLENVKLAKQSHAIGIKFYPPSGYRPADTVIPPKPQQSWWECISSFFGFSNEKIKQWNSRYKRLDATDINTINNDFFSYAEMNNLVIFSHQTKGGFEADSEYGQIFGNPGYWAKVLKDHPDLKLIIAHSGGGEGWFGEFNGSLAQQAYNLCVLYKNVYCDFGFFDEVFIEQKRVKLQSNLRTLISSNKATDEEAAIWRNKPLFENNVGTAPWKYPITDKIMYGSDWMMVSRLKNQRDFIASFNKVFVDDLEPYKIKFFSLNAKDILGLD